jgi:hypothetical protein
MIRLGVQVHNGVPFLVGRAEDFAEVWGIIMGIIAHQAAKGRLADGAAAISASNEHTFGIHLPRTSIIELISINDVIAMETAED